ncbi:hypothetical protein Xmau_00178 [Xenorhabdus mauleonii]|uniref:Uncharacterized protein n=1 Tax=Xenorhabdus mauleonii TaxID=351675 RepID=A0A1I3N438_9GAMM|nr:hypothetical protein [Xenorhabdus mauleonii]PHM45790.1 hypothetical protein Xmau_00178 [Xenorhabdus mauleonii]SFJ03902.1 hypothetical protein SAMN05421680_10582 [Xenorhabdus mauleonii]
MKELDEPMESFIISVSLKNEITKCINGIGGILNSLVDILFEINIIDSETSLLIKVLIDGAVLGIIGLL